MGAMSVTRDPAVWLPAVRTGTGTDVFTERLAEALGKRGTRTEIIWLPLRAEYAPWTVPVPQPPAWATVAHVNTWLHSRFLPKRLPIVATIHHSVHHPDARTYKGPLRAAYHRHWIAPNERRVLRRADRVIAVSNFVAETAKQTLVDVPMEVIHNGVDTERFQPGNRQRKAGEPFRLLYVGSWMARKGVDLLAPIMRELGDGFELRYTGGAAAEHEKPGMPHNMHDIGRLVGEEAVSDAMRNADALLFPSRSEGHPLVVVEAMACGLPIIATCGSSLVEVIDNGVTGVLAQRDNVEEFVAAARDLTVDRELYGRMVDAARQRTVCHFTDVKMVDAYDDIYRTLVRF